ncbi:MAG: diacylglycerol kinase family protein [Bacillota bacterium]|nr:diacylglycerol kinase family protein [Bacillota bacterium]
MDIRKLRQSFACAFRGIVLCLRNERNFRIHICAAFYASVLGIAAKFGALEFSVLFLCFASVMATELLNTAVERVCDIMSAEYSVRIKAIKDISAGAVLVCAVFAFLTGAVLFLNKENFNHIISFLMQPAALVLLLTVPAAVFFSIGKRRDKWI